MLIVARHLEKRPLLHVVFFKNCANVVRFCSVYSIFRVVSLSSCFNKATFFMKTLKKMCSVLPFFKNRIDTSDILVFA